jgi:hypothetical protein
MKISSTKWDGKHSISLLEFEFDGDWYLETSASLQEILHMTPEADPEGGDESISSVFSSKRGRVLFYIDSAGCYLAFESEIARNEATIKLVTQLDWQLA